MDSLQCSIAAPTIEVVEHPAFRGQILWQVPPPASRREHVHDAVDDFAYVHLAFATAGFRQRDQSLDMLPFFVGQIAWVPQMAALVAFAVLDGPHSVTPSPRIRATSLESQVTHPTPELSKRTLRAQSCTTWGRPGATGLIFLPNVLLKA